MPHAVKKIRTKRKIKTAKINLKIAYLILLLIKIRKYFTKQLVSVQNNTIEQNLRNIYFYYLNKSIKYSLLIKL